MSDEIVQLRITEVAYGGRGVARDCGLVVFVPGTLPCELVLARIEARHKSYAEARLVKVLEPSPFRTAGDCALCDPTASPTARCAGCCYQHVLYEEEVRLKQTQLKILLERLGKVSNPPCLPPIPAPSPTGYRDKLALHVVWQAGRIVIGYVADDNRTVIEVEKCALASPAVNRLLAEIRCRRDVLRLSHSAARIVLRQTEQQGATWWWAHEAPKECFVEETTLGPVEVPAGSFFQVNPAVANLLVDEVTQLIEQVRPEQVLDLHCGVGIFALAAARAGVPACGIDQDSNAIGAARRNAARLGLSNVRFHCAQAHTALRQMATHLTGSRLLVVADPPRQGLDRDTIAGLTDILPANLLYVSCTPDRLARDIALLAPAGYRLAQARLLDMFPRTAYFESVALISRSDF